MPLAVPPHLAFCIDASGVTFLDIRRDRYFGLPSDLAEAFTALEARGFAGYEPSAAIERLLSLGLIAPSTALTPRVSAPRANASWADLAAGRSTRWEVMAAARTARSVLQARHTLQHRSFEMMVEGLRRRRPQRGDRAPGDMRPLVEAFQRARRWTPIKPVCLLDSLALLDFLDGFGHRPQLVFGVIRRPFTAHCWVQHGDIILNDRLDHVVEHTPILVV